MQKNKAFTLVELLIVIAIIGILAVIALIAFNSARQSARDGARKSICQTVSKANELYHDTNNDYATLVGDTNANCAGAGAATLVGAGVMGCPSQQARSAGADATWDSVYTYVDEENYSVTTELERGGTFSCDQDGCR